MSLSANHTHSHPEADTASLQFRGEEAPLDEDDDHTELEEEEPPTELDTEVDEHRDEEDPPSAEPVAAQWRARVASWDAARDAWRHWRSQLWVDAHEAAWGWSAGWQHTSWWGRPSWHQNSWRERTTEARVWPGRSWLPDGTTS